MELSPGIHPDIRAMMDVIDEMSNGTDSMSIEDAVALRDSVVELRRAAAVLLGFIDTQLVNTLESPREINGMSYRIGNKGKWRPDRMIIDSRVRRAALADENGEIRPAGEAVDEAIRIMNSCYVANATFPKTGALEALGLDKTEVGTFEGSGKELKIDAVKPK